MPITNSIGYTLSKEQSKAMLLEALEVKSVIENLRGVHLINTIPNGRIERINWNENLNTLNEKIHTKVLGRSSIKKLLQRFLNLEKILALSENSASKLKAPKHSDSAHQSRVHNDAKSVFDKDFVSVINERYPNANKKQQIKNATIESVIEPAYPVVAFDTPVERLGSLITKENGAVLAKDEKGEYHIVTRYDVIQSLAK